MWKFGLKSILIFVTILYGVNLSAQIEDFPDTLRIDSSHQELKVIIQKKDSTVLLPVDSLKKNLKTAKPYDPRKSWWMSAIIPGLGQAYNKKYWKIPIIYTIFAGSLYIISDNNFKYRIYKEAYANFPIDGAPSWSPTITERQLKDAKNFYKRNRDLAIIVGVVFYLMNIMDAKVDADLMDFDISDDLSLHVEPQIKPVYRNFKNTFGLKFVLSLNKKY